MRRSRKARGYALITVLWMGLGLLLGASAFLSGARQEALGARAEIEATRALELARSGLNMALADLGRIGDGMPVGPRDGTPVELTMAEGKVRYAIRDENGKIDVGNAPVELLRPVLTIVGEEAGFDAFDASNIADALISRRRSEGGRAASLPDILSDVGLSPEAADVARQYLTTFNFTAQVNPRTAPPAVLAAIPGLGPGDIEDIVVRRQTGRPMPRMGSASVWLVERQGPVYTIDAEATLAGGARAVMSVRVVRRGLSFRGGRMIFDVLETRIVR